MLNDKIIVVGPIFFSLDKPLTIGAFIYRELTKTYKYVLKVSSYHNRVLRLLNTILVVIFKSSKYDVILVQSYGQLAFAMEDILTRLAKAMHKPICFTLHGGAFYEFYQRHPKWVKKVLNRVQIVNTPSYFLKEKLSELGTKIEYLPNAINLEDFPYNRNVKNKFTLLWVRAFHDIYHPELAIETVLILKQKYPSIKLTMVGPDQGILPYCKTLIDKHNLQENIEIVGYVPNNELYNYYQSHQVFLTTTRYESFGVAIIEAGACGIPCVSVSVGEIPYLWKNEENILLAERKPEEFSYQISRLFEDEKLRNKISVNARKNAEKFTWENVMPLWKGTINQLSHL